MKRLKDNCFIEPRELIESLFNKGAHLVVVFGPVAWPGQWFNYEWFGLKYSDKGDNWTK